MPNIPSTRSQPAQANASRPRIPITPDLVSKVADRVFILLLNDLKIERERKRGLRFNPFHFKGER
jgi:hypothetical protein